MTTLTPQRVLDLAVQHEIAIEGYGWRWIMLFRKALKPADQLTAVWNDYRDKWGGDPGPNFWKESTYEDCTNWSLDPVGKVLTIVMVEGDNMNGRRLADKGRTWTFNLPESFAEDFIDKHVKPMVMTHLKYAAEVEFERREKVKRDLIVQGIFNEMLGEKV